MKQRLYSVRDNKTGFLAPISRINDAVAIRDFQTALQSAPPDSLYFTHPGDFSLYFVGCFDDEAGQFDVVLPTHLADGVSSFKGGV